MKKVLTLFYLLPKLHRAALSLIAIITFGIVIIPFERAQASKNISNNPENTVNAMSQNVISAVNKNKPESQHEIDNNPPEESQQFITIKTEGRNYIIRKGDTLAAIFQRANLSPKVVYEISQLSHAKKHLLRLMPNESITISKDEQGNFVSLNRQIDNISTLVIEYSNGEYKERIDKKQVRSRTKFTEGTITSSFWNAAINANISPNQIMELTNIFGWDIDFSLDLREGDKFAIIYEKKYANGQFLENGHILAAEFINQGEKYTAIRYKDGQYYSESGRSLRKAFLRSPVHFKYISSNFNPRRKHPVTGSVKAHRGVDYVAPIGTPIKAAGSGRVIQSGYNKYNGNYIFIRHNNTYTTKYLHLTKKLVRRGQFVQQGDTIGTLGKTGRVTGAHLHYEFIVNGVHRNPRTISLPVASPIAQKEKEYFDKLSVKMITKLNQSKKLQLANKEY